MATSGKAVQSRSLVIWTGWAGPPALGSNWTLQAPDKICLPLGCDCGGASLADEKTTKTEPCAGSERATSLRAKPRSRTCRATCDSARSPETGFHSSTCGNAVRNVAVNAIGALDRFAMK